MKVIVAAPVSFAHVYGNNTLSGLFIKHTCTIQLDESPTANIFLHGSQWQDNELCRN